MLSMADPNDQTTLREAILRAELKALTDETVQMNKYRSYFEGDQPMAYSTEIFSRTFGEAFAGFVDNWCEVVVNAVNSRLKLEGFVINDDEEFETAKKIWEVFRKNEIENQQKDLHEGALVEGRAFVIVWPDDELGATIDWQPGQLCRVFYDPDRRSKALWAVKRWEGPTGEVYVTFYTPEAVYKFTDSSGINKDKRPESRSALTEIPGVGYFPNLTQRNVEGEEWPVRNEYGIVPVVEFNNTSYRSEIKGTIPQQDALNKTLLDMMVTSEFQAFNQRVVETSSNAPEGGWDASPGEVWQFKPTFDADGKYVPSQFKVFEAADPSTYMRPIEMWLQHMALTSSTPVRYFMQSDRGGRGDSPSGDSLLVDDKPLNDKVDDKQDAWGPRWFDVAKLVAMSIGIDGTDMMLGSSVWRDPRHDSRLAKLTEGKTMIEIGIPVEFVVTQIGLQPDEVRQVLDAVEKAKAEAEAKEQERMAMAAANSQQDSQPKPSESNSE